MQGQLTCAELYQIISSNKIEESFPLLDVIHGIAFRGDAPTKLIEVFQQSKMRNIKTQEECNHCIVPHELAKLKAKLTELADEAWQMRKHDSERKK
eukprot:Trichotokara_eunicae@DN4748_c0_g1_i2.p1